MRSVPVSMTWEILRRGRWSILAATLGAIAFPTIILLSLRHDGGVPAQDKSMIVMNFVMMLVITLCFSAAMYDAQGKVSRLYAYPIRTSTIVAFRLLPAMLIIALQMIFVTMLLNFLYDLRWPIWGPSLLAAVAFASVEAAIWLTEKSTGWLVVAVTIVGAILGLWYKSHFGDAFSETQHIWESVTPADAATMLAFAAVAYGVAVVAVARNRRGEMPISLGIADWISRFFDRSSNLANRFAGPHHATAWADWERKGWAMPFGAVCLLTLGFVVWFFSDRSAENLFSGLVVGGFTLAILGFIGGVIHGNTGTNDGDFVMRSFLATRPVSDTDLAKFCVVSAAKSMLLAWSVWVVAVAFIYGGMFLFGVGNSARLPTDLGWWYFALTLVTAWIAVGTTMSIGLAGQSPRTLQIFCVVVAIITAVAIASKFLLSPPAQLLLARAALIIFEFSIVAIGTWCFFAARRRCLIAVSTFWLAATIWLAATTLAAMALPDFSGPRIIGILLCAAGLMLVVLPVAAAPLAISINRHR